MKNIILIILGIVLLTSCNKLDLLSSEPIPQEKTELHVQLINTSAIVIINNIDYTIEANNKHIVKVYVVKHLDSFSIIKISNNGKITASIKNYNNFDFFSLGEIKDDISYKIE